MMTPEGLRQSIRDCHYQAESAESTLDAWQELVEQADEFDSA